MEEPFRHSGIGISVEAIAEAWARQESAPDGGLVVLDAEVAGRVRGGWGWTSPSSVAVGLILRPTWDPVVADKAWLVPSVAAIIALGDLGLNAHCRWPDEIVIDEIVVGRTTARVTLGPGMVDFAVVTVRLDLDALDRAGISSHVDTTSDKGRSHVTEIVGDALRQANGLCDNPEILRLEYASSCRTIGSIVHVEMQPRGFTRGRAVDVSDAGSLIVESSTGMRETVSVDALKAVLVFD